MTRFKLNNLKSFLYYIDSQWIMRDNIKKQLKEYYKTDKDYFNNLEKNFYKNIKEYTRFLFPRYFKDKKVLDAGCGSGAMVDWISRKFKAEVTGIDLSPYAIRKAKKKYRGKFFCGDLEDMPFKDESFDTVLLFDVLEHVVYPEKVFREIFRVLRQDGCLLIISPNMIFSEKVPLTIKVKEILDILLMNRKLRYIKPDTSQCACGDKEACLITNPLKIKNLLKHIGFNNVSGNILRCRLIAKK